MAKDLIVGVVDRYNWDQIKYWANSIKKSGFTGHKALLVYNMDAPTVKKLTDEGFMIIGCNQFDENTGFTHDNSRGSVMVDRFFHLYSLLEMLEHPMDVDRVVMTDVRDVVFQSNPTEWLDSYFLNNTQLLVGSENMTYGSEPWGRNNLKHAFGEYFLENAKAKEIYCAGVIAGTRMALKDFALNLWLICRGLNPQVPGGGGPDQAAMNIALGMEAYKYNTKFSNPTEGWVVHAGTSLPAIQAGSGGIGEEYQRNPNMPLPFVRNIDYTFTNGEVFANGSKVTVVHQWDRVPEWRVTFEEKYG
jgi:hypothetical protein